MEVEDSKVKGLEALVRLKNCWVCSELVHITYGNRGDIVD